MKRSTFATCARTSVLALSVLLLPLATPTFAQPATPTPATRSVDTRAERDRTDLWGLLGLAGLLGLMGRPPPRHGADLRYACTESDLNRPICPTEGVPCCGEKRDNTLPVTVSINEAGAGAIKDT